MTEMQDYDPLQARREEVAQYNANIAMYQAILATLPEQWPEELLEHRNPSKPHEAIDNVSAEHVQTVAELWYADELRHLIRTETLERTKAAAILAALEAGA
jgi:hypothetical protein